MRNGPRPFSMLVAILAVCMFAAVGFRVGQSQRSSDADAASAWQTASAAAYSPAHATAYRLAWRRGYKRGAADGTAAGRSAGALAGSAARRTQATAGSAAARAVAAVLAATPVKLAHGVKTERCIEVADGLCETLGPRITGERCPYGSVADPEGGIVCVPRLLLLAARVAGSSSTAIFNP